jgi:adenine-specific DNA-methyltransferase
LNADRAKIEHVAATSGDVLEAQVAKLRSLFPEVFVEGKIDFDKLRITLGAAAEAGPGRFHFSWAGKDDAVSLLQTPSRGTLIPCPDESIDFDTTGNAFVEGDNLEVLKLLFKPYFGRVKLIYIDPPYNTGQDFIYPDNYSDPLKTYLQLTGQVDPEGNLLTSNPETSGRYHSAWLSMIYPRLFLARQLLTEDGVICVSIDDNEVHHLRLTMNEVFGEENFVAQLIWNTEGHTDNQFDVKVNHEYVVLYAKSSDTAALGHVVDPNTREKSNLWKGFAQNSITKNGPANPPSVVVLPVGFPCEAENLALVSSRPPDQFFEEVEKTKFITRQLTDRFKVTYPIRFDAMRVVNGRLAAECRVYSGWANLNKLRAFIENDFAPIEDEGDLVRFFLSDKGVLYYRRERAKARNILSVLRNMGTTEKMRSELEELGISFQYPKPKELIRYLIEIGAGREGLVLDFFAGSATTAQALFELNRDDGGRRRFILVQLPEPAAKVGASNIADIAKERIRLVSAKMRKDRQSQLKLDAETIDEDLGFKVFKLGPPNIQQWKPDVDRDPEAYAQELALFNDPLVLGWKPENVIWEVALREGFGLRTVFASRQLANGNKIFEVTDPDTGQTFTICLDDQIRMDFTKQLGLKQDSLLVCRDIALDDSSAANLALQCRLKTI